MERKIGEIFEYKGEWYQCLKSPDGSCKHCDMNFGGKCPIPIKECVASSRSDLSYVIFKKLEKVGKPITVKGGTFQKLILDNCSCENCVFNVQNKQCYKNSYIDGPCCGDEVWVEIKQNKEDTMEETKLNIKPFSLEAAKAGKPVCTRDGRKARIICFDAEGNKPLIVLSKIDGKEVILRYTEKGQSDNFHSPTPREDDLMMLPEKKEGWVNVYNSLGVVTFSHNPYDTKKEALANVKPKYYVDTVKINWEEQP